MNKFRATIFPIVLAGCATTCGALVASSQPSIGANTPVLTHPTVHPQSKGQSKLAATLPKTHFERGLYYKQHGQTNAALVEFLKSTQDNPRQVNALYEQALIFRTRGYTKLAESALEQSLALNPNFQQARILLAAIRIQQGNLGGAVDQLTKTLGIAVVPPKGTNEVRKNNAPPNRSGIDPASPLSAYVLQSMHYILKEPRTIQALHSISQDERTTESIPDIPTASQPEPQKTSARKLRIRWIAESSQNQAPEEKERNWLASWIFPEDKDSKFQGRSVGRVVSEKPATNQSITVFASMPEEATVPPQTPAQPKLVKQIPFSKPIAANKPPIQQAHIIASAPKDSASMLGKNLLGILEDVQPPYARGLNQQKAKNADSQELEIPKGAPVDAWTLRLKYLAEHGTSSLRPGEAFMFSEDTGEATIFLPYGNVIRRTISAPRDTKEIVLLRRPDILKAEELMYNLSLLGKLMPKPTDINQSKTATTVSTDKRPAFSAPDFSDKSQSLLGWVRNIFKSQ